MAENRGFEYRETVGGEAQGKPLLAYLAARYAHSTAEEWASRIEAGRVLLDGNPASAEEPLRSGQILLWRRPPWKEPEAPSRFEVLFDDDDILAVSKPAGLPTLPGAGFLDNTLLARVRALDPDAAPLHRLGRFTSGVVLFARNRESRADLARQFAARAVRKLYRAVASGEPAQDAFTVTVPIGPVAHPVLGTVHAASPSGRPAMTHVRVIERRAGCFVCDVRIETGRPHQIRIHLAVADHPLVGDPLYGPGGLPYSGTRALPGDPGYLLHAAEIRFRHPRDGREIVVRAQGPECERQA